MPEYLWTARLEAAATARNVSLKCPQTLAGDGSDRRYYRLLGSPTIVLLFHPFPPGDEVNENDSYYLVGRHLRAQGVPVPEIYTYCREEFWMMIEDLGDISLESATTVTRSSLPGGAADGAGAVTCIANSNQRRDTDAMVKPMQASVKQTADATCRSGTSADAPGRSQAPGTRVA